MDQNEFRALAHGEKIQGSDGVNYIVHNNHRSGSGMVVAVRTVIIRYQDCGGWRRVSKLKNTLVPGTYQVTIDKKID